MSNLLLRKLTMRSIIGFGLFPDLCVQELIQLRKYKELISMYYTLAKIDFDDEVKEYLKIKGDRVIPKPSKNPQMYKDNVYKMVCEINEAEFNDKNLILHLVCRNKSVSKKFSKRKNNIIEAKFISPMKNQLRNQYKYK